MKDTRTHSAKAVSSTHSKKLTKATPGRTAPDHAAAAYIDTQAVSTLPVFFRINSVQLDLFVPHEKGFDFKVIVTNERSGAKHVVAFHEERRAGSIFAELEWQYGIVRRLHAIVRRACATLPSLRAALQSAFSRTPVVRVLTSVGHQRIHRVELGDGGVTSTPLNTPLDNPKSPRATP